MIDERDPSIAISDPAMHLMAAICARAVEDLARGDLIERLGALLWLSTDEAILYFETLGLGDPLAVDTKRLGKMRRQHDG